MKKIQLVYIAILGLFLTATSCKKVVKDLDISINSLEYFATISPTDSLGSLSLTTIPLKINFDSIILSNNAQNFTLKSLKLRMCQVDVVNASPEVSLTPIDSFIGSVALLKEKTDIINSGLIPNATIYLEPKVSDKELVSYLDKNAAVFNLRGSVSEPIKKDIKLKIRMTYKATLNYIK